MGFGSYGIFLWVLLACLFCFALLFSASLSTTGLGLTRMLTATQTDKAVLVPSVWGLSFIFFIFFFFRFLFLYLHLFIAIEHVSHRKAL